MICTTTLFSCWGGCYASQKDFLCFVFILGRWSYCELEPVEFVMGGLDEVVYTATRYCLRRRCRYKIRISYRNMTHAQGNYGWRSQLVASQEYLYAKELSIQSLHLNNKFRSTNPGFEHIKNLLHSRNPPLHELNLRRRHYRPHLKCILQPFIKEPSSQFRTIRSCP